MEGLVRGFECVGCVGCVSVWGCVCTYLEVCMWVQMGRVVACKVVVVVVRWRVCEVNARMLVRVCAARTPEAPSRGGRGMLRARVR